MGRFGKKFYLKEKYIQSFFQIIIIIKHTIELLLDVIDFLLLNS